MGHRFGATRKQSKSTCRTKRNEYEYRYHHVYCFKFSGSGWSEQWSAGDSRVTLAEPGGGQGGDRLRIETSSGYSEIEFKIFCFNKLAFMASLYGRLDFLSKGFAPCNPKCLQTPL